MIVCQCFFLVCLIRASLSFYIDEECDAKSEWRKDISRFEYRIGVWVQPSKNDVIELKITFHGYQLDDRLTFDKIKLTKSNSTFIKSRNLDEEIKSWNISSVIPDGWNQFQFHIKRNYVLFYMGDSKRELLMQGNIDDYDLKSLIVSGSSITLNCPLETRVWKVSDHPVIVPLDSSPIHYISFYSSKNMTPSITIGLREISLGWDGHSITTVENRPLLPFQLYNISVACEESKRPSCRIQVDGDTLEIIPVNSIPNNISFHKGVSNSFSVILHRDFESLTQTNATQIITIKQENTREITVIAVLGVLVLTLIVVIASILVWKQVFKSNDDEVDANQEKASLMQQSTIDSPESNLLNAVRQNNRQRTESLLSNSTVSFINYQRAYNEANLLGRFEILKKFTSFKDSDRESTIEWVQQEYNKRVHKVFQAAENGCYQPGVASLLRQHDLPPTIRDEKGGSILHSIACSKDENGGPLWTAENIRDFLDNRKYNPNAVNYKGRTCLHLLAGAANTSKAFMTWDEHEIDIETAWVELAKILIEYGCNSKLKDYNGKLPQTIAATKRNLKLSELFEMKNFTKTEPMEFGDLMKVVKDGKTASLINAMLANPELLPLEGTQNPLTVAVTRGRLEATLLLLGGGASICGRSFVTITPLEAAHGLKNLPAIFPAIMRRECINQLKFEKRKVGDESKNKKIHDYINRLISDVKNGKTKMDMELNETSPTDEGKVAREMLCLAAAYGLTLTCQMIGLQRVNLHPYPDEDKPVAKAIKHGHHNIATVLYRDLQMSPFAHISTDSLSKEFLEQVWNSEYSNLKENCETKEDGKLHETCLELVTKAHNGEKIELTENRILAFIAKCGLDYIVHILKNNVKDFNINNVVDNLTGCTMLHIAAMFGRYSTIEYLLYDNSLNIVAKANGALTAAHLAAIKGDEECMKYLQYFMDADYGICDIECKGGQKAVDFLNGYRKLVENSKSFVLSEDMVLEILSTPSFKEKTKLLLERMCKVDISNDQGFLNIVRSLTKDEQPPMANKILESINNLMNAVLENDERFKGSIAMYTLNSQGLDIPFDTMTIYWEVNSPQFGEFKVEHEINNHQNSCSMYVKFASGECNFSENFYIAVKKILSEYSFEIPLWLLYPSIKRDPCGVVLPLHGYKNGCSWMIEVIIIPVLKTKEQPESYKSQFKNPVFKDIELTLYLANSTTGKWSFVTKQIEINILSKVKDDQRLVLLGCKMLTKILFSCWWYPVMKNKRHIKTWKSCVTKLQTLPDSVLTSLFLEEINLTDDDDWTSETFLDHVIAIFKRAVTEDDEDSPRSGKFVRLFLDVMHSSHQCNALIHPIIEFLENIKYKTQDLQISSTKDSFDSESSIVDSMA